MYTFEKGLKKCFFLFLNKKRKAFVFAFGFCSFIFIQNETPISP